MKTSNIVLGYWSVFQVDFSFLQVHQKLARNSAKRCRFVRWLCVIYAGSMKDMNIRWSLTVQLKAIGTITKNRSELVWKSLARNSVVAVAAFHRITCPHPYAFVGSLVSSIRVRQSSYFTVHFWKKRQYNFILLGEDLLVAIFLFTCDAPCLHNWVNLFSVFLVTPMIGIHCCFFLVWSGCVLIFSNKLSSERIYFGFSMTVAWFSMSICEWVLSSG